MESTKVCMKCGKEIPAEFIFCPFCGADQTKNICKNAEPLCWTARFIAAFAAQKSKANHLFKVFRRKVL